MQGKTGENMLKEAWICFSSSLVWKGKDRVQALPLYKKLAHLGGLLIFLDGLEPNCLSQVIRLLDC